MAPFFQQTHFFLHASLFLSLLIRLSFSHFNKVNVVLQARGNYWRFPTNLLAAVVQDWNAFFLAIVYTANISRSALSKEMGEINTSCSRPANTRLEGGERHQVFSITFFLFLSLIATLYATCTKVSLCNGCISLSTVYLSCLLPTMLMI